MSGLPCTREHYSGAESFNVQSDLLGSCYLDGDTTKTLIHANTLRPTNSSEDKLFKLLK